MIGRREADGAVKAVLAGVIAIGFFVILFVLFRAQTDFPAGVKEMLLVLLGALISSFKDITSYYFGSSAGSERKDRVIAESVANTASAGAAPVLTVTPQVSVAPEAPVTVTPTAAQLPKDTP
jgi:hypothetical protein